MINVLAFLAFWRSLLTGLFLGWDLKPDTHLYSQGGLGLFPSPLGRLFGVFGPTELAIVNALAAAGCIYLVAAIARQIGRNAKVAAAVAWILPLTTWTLFNSVDSAGALLALSAVLAVLRGRQGAAALGWTLSAFAHTSVVPAAVLAVSRKPVVLVLGIASVFLLSFSPYGAILHFNVSVSAIVAAKTLILVLLCVLPCLYGLYRSRLLWAPAIVLLAGALASAALQAGNDPSHTNCRYALPFSMLAASAVKA